MVLDNPYITLKMNEHFHNTTYYPLHDFCKVLTNMIVTESLVYSLGNHCFGPSVVKMSFLCSF